jgi:glycine/D-amino acid oxidase-like deaminating enzyme
VSATPEWDAIVVGAGHNGLAATALLAKRGLRVLCLEKNGYPGGMAGTREILGLPQRRRREPTSSRCQRVAEELELALRRRAHPSDHGVEPELRGSPPAVFSNPLRMALTSSGTSASARWSASSG